VMGANHTLGKNYPQIASQMHFLEVKSRNQGPTRFDRVTALAYIREPKTSECDNRKLVEIRLAGRADVLLCLTAWLSESASQTGTATVRSPSNLRRRVKVISSREFNASRVELALLGSI